ncbi:DNA N-glycosylase and apurinic/apyrimidinic (AP) lyase [Pleurotus ostreatus]|uniref:Endonuclease III homolog n=1 Tax=Pleurotus ostreatus TaxID=5322 RepID=A0A8H6ZQU4_PLEOS|nr:DNA N-glycosylase and apurinic/apyrimidinic (AP) lyase [Pleurotus ostreatus]KAF7428092.1 DNA N-glycosylase and apurinic/apyrimidinic (AP) lyase [Pleurotus ostreatus]
MSAIRRSQTTRITRLSSRASPYHASVTLFEAKDPGITADAANNGEAPTRSSTPRRPRARRVKVEEDMVDIEDMVAMKPEADTDPPSLAESSKVKKPRRSTQPKSPRKPKAIQQSLDKPHPAPENWRETYDAIKEMRSKIVAPVDTMGCDQAQYKETEPKNKRFATLVSLMLSSQTKDEVTDAAVSNLREALGGSLSVDGLINSDEQAISNAICKVGFWRRKTQYLKQTAQMLKDNFDSDVPKTVDELCSLPGVGPKMAFLTLHSAWNLNVGIGVDVHVHRITNRLGWHKPPTNTPEETRLNLQSWLPTELHREINHMLVGFGQVVCLPVGPRCGDCTLRTQQACPSARNVGR